MKKRQETLWTLLSLSNIHLVYILSFFVLLSTINAELHFFTEPISTVPTDSYYEPHENPWITPSNLYIYNPNLKTPSNSWWMNMVLPGGTGFFSLEVVGAPEYVQDATKQISEVELISLGIEATIGSIVQVTRDVFLPNNNQGCYLIMASPVGIRFTNQEIYTNNSYEYSPLINWSFQASCKEGVQYNSASGTSPENWTYKATDWSENSATFQYQNIHFNGYFNSYQVKYSPYQTFQYYGQITPLFSSVGVAKISKLEVISTNNNNMNNNNNNNNNNNINNNINNNNINHEKKLLNINAQYTGTQFKLTMSDNSVWIISSSSTITFELTKYINYQIIPNGEPKPPNPLNFEYLYLSEAQSLSPPIHDAKIGYEYQYHQVHISDYNTIVSTTTFQGIIRISKIPNYALNDNSMLSSIQNLLITYSNIIPTKADAYIVEWQESLNHIGYYFNYTSIDMNGVSTQSSPLFAFSPYLIQNLIDYNPIYQSLSTNRGTLFYLSGDEFLFDTTNQVTSEYYSDNVKILEGVNQLTPNDINTLIDQLEYDLKWTNITTYYDSYVGGKELQSLAEMNLFLSKTLADQSVGSAVIYSTIENGLNKLKDAMTLWMSNSSFIYDQSWGGVVDSWGLFNKYSDYSNIMYQDHNFHYGYFIQAAAIIAQLDNVYLPADETKWINQITQKGVTNEELINSLIRDTSNPSKEDTNFPTWRFFDWCDGHSRPMGMFPSGSGGNEEATAEDINYFFAVMMWGKETSNYQLEVIGNVASSMIANSAKFYWQVGSSLTIYDGSQSTVPIEPNVGINQYPVVGILWDTKADPNTWFLDTDYCAVGIQSIIRLPNIISLLEDGEWTERMINYWTNPTQSSENWHIWTIPKVEDQWYSILLPLIASQYPSGSRIVWNDQRCGFDSGNSPGTILWNTLYNQAKGALIVGTYPPLNPPEEGYPPLSGFPLIASEKNNLLTGPNGPINAYQNDLNAQPSYESQELTIINNSNEMGLNPNNYPTSESWAQQGEEYLSEYTQFQAAYNQQITETQNLPYSQALADWQAFAGEWGLPVLDTINAIQHECVLQLEKLNHYYNLCIANMNAMNNIILRTSLESCLDLLDDLSDQLAYYSVPTDPPSTQADLTFWSTGVVYSPNFPVEYPELDANPTGKSCVQNFCNYSEIPVPVEYQNTKRSTRDYNYNKLR